MRRLPIFFVLDVSESMVGENLQHLEAGLGRVVRILRADPHALETVYLSVIAFAGVAKTLVPLVELASFYPPRLPLGGGTALGAALMHLMQTLDQVLLPTTAQHKGDWRPIIYLLTDGKPTDVVAAAIAQWQDRWSRRATLVAIALGRHADVRVLRQLTEQVLHLETADDATFKQWVQWVSASVQLQSQSVGTAETKTPLAPTGDDWGEWVKTLPPPNLTVDADYVFLVGRCQTQRLPYLMRYERTADELRHEHLRLATDYYQLTGVFPLSEDYFAWSDTSASEQPIHTQVLRGAPGCPHCGNPYAFGMCGCGKLMCLRGPGGAVCPWCRRPVEFGAGDSDGFEVQRGRG